MIRLILAEPARQAVIFWFLLVEPPVEGLEKKKNMAGDKRLNARADSIYLGASPLSWVNEVLKELGAGTTRETCLTEAANAGYDRRSRTGAG